MTPETTRNERKILKKIILLADANHEVSLKQLNLTERSLSLNLLRASKLIEFTHPDSWGNHPKFVKLTDSGRVFFDFKHEEVKRFFMRSIFVPILTSLSVTAILWIIGWLAGAIH